MESKPAQSGGTKTNCSIFGRGRLASITLPGQHEIQQMGRSWGVEKLQGGKLSLIVLGSQPRSWENSTETVQQWHSFPPAPNTRYESVPWANEATCKDTRDQIHWTSSFTFFTELAGGCGSQPTFSSLALERLLPWGVLLRQRLPTQIASR